MKRKINRYDISLIVLIILISSFFIYYNSKNIVYSNNNRAIIYSENKIVGEYTLNNGFKDEFTIKSSGGGSNTVKVENGKIWIEDADCPDKYCIHQGKVSGDGQVLVCLPNKLIIKIVSDEKNKEIDFIAP